MRQAQRNPKGNIMNKHFLHSRILAGAFFAGIALSGTLGVARAQQTPDNDSLLQRIEELDQQIRVVARLNEIAQEDAKAAAAKLGKASAGEGGYSLSSADGAYALRIRAFVQLQGQHFLGNAGTLSRSAAVPSTNPDTTRSIEPVGAYTIKRLQPDISGALGKNFDWRVHVNLAAGTVDALDVNLDWKILPELNLRAGKFKPPTGLERLIASPRAPFIDGSFVTVLQPNRDLGLQLYGDVGKGLLEYQAGLFNGARDGQNNTTDNNNDKDLYVRLFASPFARSESEWVRGFGLGVSGSRGKHNQYNAPAQRAVAASSSNAPTGTTPVTVTPSVSGIGSYSTGRQTFFSYNNSADTSEGTLTRISPQASYYAGPLGIIAEYTQTTQTLRLATFSNELTNKAWAVTASWFLTGEKNVYKTIKVKKANTFPSLDGIGAVELLGRVHGIQIDDKAFEALSATPSQRYADPAKSASAATGYGLALGWYLNSNVKIFASYERTDFTGGTGISARTGTTPADPVVEDRDSEQVLSLTFNTLF
jgi:phosphate-selective porin OprO/OprP